MCEMVHTAAHRLQLGCVHARHFDRQKMELDGITAELLHDCHLSAYIHHFLSTAISRRAPGYPPGLESEPVFIVESGTAFGAPGSARNRRFRDVGARLRGPSGGSTDPESQRNEGC